jgi:uncharacterized protein
MSPLEAALIVAVGAAAGTVNTVVGSGSLITFPTLLALGYAPLTANVSNTVGLFPGTISGSIGYRRELSGQLRRCVVLGAAALIGSLCGGLLLLALPPTSFERVVPFLILIACGLVAFQDRLSGWLAGHREHASRRPSALLLGGVFATGVYGGYFGAAQGVILIALLGILLNDDLQRLNALKNVLSAAASGAAAVLFIVAGPVAWLPALLLAIGAIAGGQAGALLARRLRPDLLRVVVVVVGLVVAVRLLIG